MIVRIKTEIWLETDKGEVLTPTDLTDVSVPYREKWSVKAAIDNACADMWHVFGRLLKQV